MAIDIETYYRRYGPMVIRRCRQILNDEEMAIDATHDVFVQLLRKKDRLTDQAPSGLLLRMATNICLNIIRSQRRHPENPDDEMLARIAGMEDEERGITTRLRLDRIFAKESISTRTMAVLHYVDGLTLEEVASEFGMSVSGVRKRLRALRTRAIELEGAYHV